MKIQIDKSVEEFEIGDKTYPLNVADDLLSKYEERFSEMQRKASEIFSLEEQSELVKGLLDFMFQSDVAGEEIYQACGKSTFAMVGVVEQILEHVGTVLSKKKNAKLKNYLAKK